MDIQPLAHMLEDLLHEASDEGLEACLAESPREADRTWVEAVYAEYEARYVRAVEAVREVRGVPTFAADGKTAGGPLWHVSGKICCWSDDAGVIYVALREEDGVVRLLGGARPHPIERDAITLLPPAG